MGGSKVAAAGSKFLILQIGQCADPSGRAPSNKYTIYKQHVYLVMMGDHLGDSVSS